MCLNPIRIVNPKTRFSIKGGHPLFLEVPCGHCAECQEHHQNEYKLRSYYEALSTFDVNGYIINDTLTYSDEELPHLSDQDLFFKGSQYDYPCFSHKDFRLFMVCLRELAKERLGIPAQSIKYFMAAEYGTSEYKTHRPHLHVLFFIRNSFDPVAFSYLISDCWKHGRTDGVRFKGRTYFFQKRCFSRSTNDNVLHLTNVAKYVCKYLTKDSTFQTEIEARLSRCMLYKFGDDWQQDREACDYFRTLKRHVCQFHRNSQKFGLDALRYNDINEVLHSGMMSMKSTSNVIQHVPIPTYFKRKLFYQLVKDFRGQPKWELTPFGTQWKMNRTEDSIRHLANRFASWYEQLKFDSNNFSYNVATDFLGSRSWNDFAKYILFYKGRILPFPHHERMRAENFTLQEDPLPLDLSLTLQYESEDSSYECFNYLDKESKCVTFQFHGDKFLPRYDQHGRSFLTLKEYARFIVINESTYRAFKDFDKIFDLYCSTQHPFNQIKQKAYDKRKQLKDLFGQVLT